MSRLELLDTSPPSWLSQELGEMRETLTDAVETLNARRAADAAEPASLELAQMVRTLLPDIQPS